MGLMHLGGEGIVLHEFLGGVCHWDILSYILQPYSKLSTKLPLQFQTCFQTHEVGRVHCLIMNAVMWSVCYRVK